MRNKPTTVQIIETAEGRFVVATFLNGSSTTTRVEMGGTPRRKQRRPIARATVPKQDRQQDASEQV